MTGQAPIPGPRSRALAQALRACESPNVTYIAPDFPIFWKEAHGCWVTDVDDNRFLDMTSAFGVSAVGHGHPSVVAAVVRQASLLLHGMGDVHPTAVKVRLCERLCELCPIPNARVILSQNGSDAVESALKTAHLATGRPGVIAFTGGYHGLSYGALDATHRPDFREPFLRQLGRFTTHLPFGCDMTVLEASFESGAIGAVLLEPIQGRGGIIVPPPGWLQSVRKLCSRRGVLLIADEIFTGWGRTGSLFACRYDGVLPDILCMGKAMGGGLPISACAAGLTVMDAWGESRGEALHTSTFLGNPLSCAAALAAIGVIVENDLAGRARAMGARLEQGLKSLKNSFPEMVLAIRGRGLMLGMELAGPELALAAVSRALSAGMIVLPAGDGRVLEFVPPLVITEDEIDTALTILGRVLTELRAAAPESDTRCC